MASRRPSQQPTIAMPAVDPDPDGDLPTNPTASTHERTTSRPAAPGWVSMRRKVEDDGDE